MKGEGKNARYALVSGGETAGGGYIFDSVLVTGYDYVEITEYNGLARAKDSDGLYTLFGAGGRVKSICYKEARSYALYGTDTVSMYALRADDNRCEYTWYVRRIENWSCRRLRNMMKKRSTHGISINWAVCSRRSRQQ